jgi:predicted RecA/RadA family phage recombinase
MALEATYLKAPDVIDFTAAAALVSGQVVQLPDGRAGVIAGAGAGFAVGDAAAAQVKGIFRVAKTASIVILAGQEVWWDISANKAIHSSVGGDFPIGVAVADVAAAGTTVDVDLNVKLDPAISLQRGGWTATETNGGQDQGLGLTELAGTVKAEFDAVAEAATAALLSDHSVVLANNPIFEAVVEIADNGDDAALDINIGLANASHATDADSITESVFFHVDGNVLNILAESDDGTTEVAATDTTVDYVEGTPFFVQIDARNLADIQLYINGVNVLPASVFKLDAATGPIKALLHVEKTSNDTVANVQVSMMHVRTGLNT